MPLKSRIDKHVFRDENKLRHISPKKFQVRVKYQTPIERREKAIEDGKTLISSGEIMSTRKPFEFRAPQPLKSNSKGFAFNPLSEQERIADALAKNEMFETEQYNRSMYVKTDLHRSSEKTRWLSPKGFNVTTRHESVSGPNSTRNSFM